MDGLEIIKNKIKHLLKIINKQQQEIKILKEKIYQLESEKNSIQKESEDMLLEVESLIGK